MRSLSLALVFLALLGAVLYCMHQGWTFAPILLGFCAFLVLLTLMDKEK